MEIGNCNKVNFVREVNKKVVSGNKKLANEYVNAVFEVISEQILDGNAISINGVGKFEPFITKERICTDFSQKDSNGKLLRDINGKPLTKVVSPKFNVKFRLVPSFKEKVKSVPIR